MPDELERVNARLRELEEEENRQKELAKVNARLAELSKPSSVSSGKSLSFGGEEPGSYLKPTPKVKPNFTPAPPTHLQQKVRQAESAKPRRTLAHKETRLNKGREKPKITPNPFAPYMGTSEDRTPFTSLSEGVGNAMATPFRKVDEMAARGILESGGGTDEAQRTYREAIERNPLAGGDNLGNQSFWQSLDPEMVRSANYGTDIGSQIVRFGLNLMTPSNALPIGGALGTAAKAPTASRALATTFALPAVQGGLQQMREGSPVEGLLNLALGGVGLSHAAGIGKGAKARRGVGSRYDANINRPTAPNILNREQPLVPKPIGRTPKPIAPEKAQTEPTPTIAQPEPKVSPKTFSEPPTHTYTPRPGVQEPVHVINTTDVDGKSLTSIRDKNNRIVTVPTEKVRPMETPPVEVPSQPITTEDILKQGVPDNAVQVESPNEILQRQQEEIGTAGSGRGGVQQGVEGTLPTGEGQTQAVPQEVSAQKPEKVAGTPPVDDFTQMRMADLEAGMGRIGGTLPDRKTFSEPTENVFTRAFRDYDTILPDLMKYDPEVPVALTNEETAVGHAEMRRMSRQIDEAKTSEESQLVLSKMSHLGKLLYRSSSEKGRQLQFLQNLVEDPTDAASVLTRLEKLTDGRASDLARRSVVRLSNKAQEVTNTILKDMEVRASRPVAQEGAKPSYGESNFTVTRFDAQAARDAIAKLRGKANTFANFSEALPHFITLARYHAEAVSNKFTDFKEAIQKEYPDLDAKEVGTIWRRMKTETPEAQAKRAEGVKARAEEKLSTLGQKREKRKRIEPSDVWKATYDFAKGTRKLDAFAQKMRERYGEQVGDEFISELFSKAAEQYSKDTRELDNIKTQMGEAIQRETYRLMSPGRKAAFKALQGVDLSRALMTSIDLSGYLRQGGILVASRPLQSRKAFRDMIKAAMTKEGYDAVLSDIGGRDNVELYARAGLDLTTIDSNSQVFREEDFPVASLDKLPPVAASARAYTAVLDRLRADTFDSLITELNKRQNPDGSPIPPTDAELQAIGGYINVASGRAALPPHVAQAMPIFARALFSPRFLISRFQYLTFQPLLKAEGSVFKGGTTRNIIAKEYGRYLSSVATVLALAKGAGAEIEFDPRSSDFLLMRFGNQEIDVLSGLKQSFTFLSRMAPLVGGRIKTAKGEILDLDKPETAVSPTRGSVAGKFIRSKASPAVGAIWSLFFSPKTEKETYKGEVISQRSFPTDYIGRETFFSKETIRLFLPIVFTNAYETFVTEGKMKPEAAVDAARNFTLETFGLGANVRDRPEEERKREFEKLKKKYD